MKTIPIIIICIWMYFIGIEGCLLYFREEEVKIGVKHRLIMFTPVLNLIYAMSRDYK